MLLVDPVFAQGGQTTQTTVCPTPSTDPRGLYSTRELCLFSGPGTATARFGAKGFDPGSPAPPSPAPRPVAAHHATASPPLCTYAPVKPDPEQLASDPPAGLGIPYPGLIVPPPPPGGSVESVACNDGTGTDLLWITLPSPSPRATRPRTASPPGPQAIYDFVSATVTLPHMAVAANPTAMGITGLASYFWISGYQGAPVTASKPDGTFTVNIVATPVSYTWGFGDGTSFTTAGQGPPSTASAVTHAYAVMSSRSPYALAGRYLVAVTASFDIRFQVTGPGIIPAWQDFSSYNLGPLTDSATLSYPVGEIISDLTTNP